MSDPAMASPDIESLSALFSGRLITDPAEMAPFLTDWRKRYVGRARAVVQPDTSADVAAVVRWCAAHRVPIVPQGGNTGLSGGATADGSGQAIVLSLARLRRVRAVDTVNQSITVEAGCVLAEVQRAAEAAGRLFRCHWLRRGVARSAATSRPTPVGFRFSGTAMPANCVWALRWSPLTARSGMG